MVVVPAGSYTMGAPPDEEVATGREDQVRVAIAKPFAVGRFAVTRGEFAAFVAATGHKTDGGCYRLSEPKRDPDRNWGTPGFTQHDRHPVVCVNWNAFLVGQDNFDGPSQLQWQYHLCRRCQRRVAQSDGAR